MHMQLSHADFICDYAQAVKYGKTPIPALPGNAAIDVGMYVHVQEKTGAEMQDMRSCPNIEYACDKH